jgi:hypothetical protein
MPRAELHDSGHPPQHDPEEVRMKLDQLFRFDARTQALTTRLGRTMRSLALVGATALALSSGALAATP